MKDSLIPGPRTPILALSLAMLVFTGASAARAQLYSAGEIVQNFTLINRETRQPMSLSDFEGKIVFLDWFAWWCPFCQAAAPQLLSGIDEWYEARNGNPAGIPVVHVGVNLQSGQEPQTQNFVSRAGLEIVLEDFNRALAGRFAASGQPIFAIINGVANSPSHRQWELLYSQMGYGQTQFPVETFRSYIDAVRAPAISAPSIIESPSSRSVALGASVEFVVQASGGGTLSYHWEKDGQPIEGATHSMLRLPSVQASDEGEYRVRVGNAGGSALSEPATLTVLIPAAITRQPLSLTVIEGGDAVLSVEVIGSAPLNYLWRHNGEPIPNAGGPELRLNPVSAGDAGEYTVEVSNSVGVAESLPATLTVEGRPAPLPARLAILGAGSGNPFRIQILDGTEGLGYRVEVSSDLIAWHLWTNIVRSAGAQMVSDLTTEETSVRFYRLASE